MNVPALLTTSCAALLLTACASTPEPEFIVPQETVIQIESYSGGMEGTEVHLINPLGEREVMGTLPSDGMKMFELQEPVLLGEYRLIAETPDGQTIGSRPFHMKPEGVRWNITSNAVVDYAWAVREDDEQLYPPVPRW